MRRSHPESDKLICRIDVTAFAGVMLGLVGMFVLSAGVVGDTSRNGALVPVDLAKASNFVDLAGANREDALVVAITRNGDVWFGADRVTLEKLPGAIRAQVSDGAERKVYIRVDQRAKYGLVGRVLDGVRAAGIEKVAFVVDQRSSSISVSNAASRPASP
ncbi:MAG TPA: biopolymer transporter ExbD [Candidatus Sulfotelmatobacter sp.]|nr:biopolymer transporter ExbD [Candidatus Sulfotelmatobacter sp.]